MLDLCFTEGQLGQKMKELVQENSKREAAYIALLYDKPKLALNTLRRGEVSESDRTLSIAILSATSNAIDDSWQDMMVDLYKSTKDPYTRTIVRLLSERNWKSALVEPDLSIRHKLGVALKYLDDEELTDYIQEYTEMAIKAGFEDAVVFTGLTDSAMDLFQTYMNRTDDLQTAVLAMSFTAPLYVCDPRFMRWREEYRTQMNTWKLFFQRVRFDTQATSMAVSWDGRKLLKPDRQMTIRCVNCDEVNQELPTRSAASSLQDPPATNNRLDFSQPSILYNPISAISCPRCGAHLPRCIICERWIGAPDPARQGSSWAASKRDPFGDAFEQCFTCTHVTHKSHADEWFAEHRVCPLQDCDCRCRDLDGFGMK